MTEPGRQWQSKKDKLEHALRRRQHAKIIVRERKNQLKQLLRDQGAYF